MRVLPCGDQAVLVELADLDEIAGLRALLRADPPRGLVDLVPAARTLLVVFDPAVTDPTRIRDELRDRPVGRETARPGRLVKIPVVYDGEDLAEVARLTGLSEREVVARHMAAEYLAAFCGFTPGFAYLTGLDPALRVPRRETPRTRVPSGAVAVAGEYTGVYPSASPGGWRLIGHTDLTLWDPDRDPPALVGPGTRVRFVEVSP